MTKEELEEWSKEEKRERQRRIDAIHEELGDVLTDEDEQIIEMFPFELAL